MPYVKGVRGQVASDLSNQVFGRMTVIERDKARTGKPRWLCRCACGVIKSIAACELKAGKTRSCGCLNKEMKKILPIRHGYNRTPTYVSWSAMLARCSNPRLRSFANYGGRGIRVCDRWKDFANFLLDMGERPEGTSIDRFPDNDGNYEPGNCRWATPKEQRANQRPKAAAQIGKTNQPGETHG